VDGPRFVRTLDEEVARIAIALVEHGTLGPDRLAQEVGAQGWPDGRFDEALRVAQRDGHIERVADGGYAACGFATRS
jgi:hypothetical protein